MTVPDNRSAFPIQRWFNETPWGTRFDQLAEYEKRIAELEVTYSIKSLQHGMDEVTATTTITSTAKPAAGVGGPRVKVAVPNSDSLVFFFAQFESRIVHAGSPMWAADIYEPTLFPTGLTLGSYKDGVSGTYYTNMAPTIEGTNADVDSTIAQGVSPRGMRPWFISFIPEGDYTFELRWRLTTGTSMTVRNARLWVDVI